MKGYPDSIFYLSRLYVHGYIIQTIHFIYSEFTTPQNHNQDHYQQSRRQHFRRVQNAYLPPLPPQPPKLANLELAPEPEPTNPNLSTTKLSGKVQVLTLPTGSVVCPKLLPRSMLL